MIEASTNAFQSSGPDRTTKKLARTYDYAISTRNVLEASIIEALHEGRAKLAHCRHPTLGLCVYEPISQAEPPT